MPRKYHGRELPPRKYDCMFLDALFETQLPMKMVATRYRMTMPRSMIVYIHGSGWLVGLYIK
jgi:acetyl esterase/lipase